MTIRRDTWPRPTRLSSGTWSLSSHSVPAEGAARGMQRLRLSFTSVTPVRGAAQTSGGRGLRGEAWRSFCRQRPPCSPRGQSRARLLPPRREGGTAGTAVRCTCALHPPQRSPPAHAGECCFGKCGCCVRTGWAETLRVERQRPRSLV